MSQAKRLPRNVFPDEVCLPPVAAVAPVSRPMPVRPPALYEVSRAFSLHTGEQFDAHDCRMAMIGWERRTDADAYQFDNTTRKAMGWLFQIGLAGEGRFRNLETGTTWTLLPGMAFLAAMPSPTRYWLPENGDWTFYYTFLSGDLAAYHCSAILRERGPVLTFPVENPVVRIMRELYERVFAGHIPDVFELSAITYRFFMEMRRYIRTPETEWPEPFRRVRAFLEDRACDPAIGVPEMAAVAGYSRAHFTRVFQEVAGESPGAYLVRRRLETAMRLLAETDLPIKDVALRVGFGGYPHFCTAFRRFMRMTPGAVRARRAALRMTAPRS